MTPRFDANQFTPTEFDSAADKAKFANHFVKFVESDFKASLFQKWFYVRLSLTFGHIAHYNQHGFWAEYFTSTKDKAHFLWRCAYWDPCGDPKFTWCDVEISLRGYCRTKAAAYQAKAEQELEAAERSELERLKNKYEAHG